MADSKTDTKLEREYVIPLRSQWKRVPRYKKANKAIRAIKEFLVKHMKIRDGDLNKIKVDKYLNEEIWFRGIRKPPARIKVKAVKEGDIVKVTLAEFPEKLKFKKAREEKIEAKAMEILEGKKKTLDKLKEQAQKPEEKSEEKAEEKKKDKDIKDSETKDKEKKEDETKKEEAKEKKAAVVESTQKMEKELAKKTKHEASAKSKEPKHQFRKALAK